MPRRGQQVTLLPGTTPPRLAPGVEPEQDEAEADENQDGTTAGLADDVAQGLVESLCLVGVESLCCVEEEPADGGKHRPTGCGAHDTEEGDDPAGARPHLTQLHVLLEPAKEAGRDQRQTSDDEARADRGDDPSAVRVLHQSGSTAHTRAA